MKRMGRGRLRARQERGVSIEGTHRVEVGWGSMMSRSGGAETRGGKLLATSTALMTKGWWWWRRGWSWPSARTGIQKQHRHRRWLLSRSSGCF